MQKYFKNNIKNEQVNVNDFELEKIELYDLLFNKSSLKNITISDSKLTNFDIRCSKLKICNFSNTEFENFFFKQSTMKNSKATGANFSEAILNNVNCKFDLSNFRIAEIKDTVFKNCDFKNSDFQRTKLRNVSFLNCNLSEVDFSQADFLKVDLRHSLIQNTKIDINNYKEITISPSQLMFIANSLGLNIKN